MLKLLKNCLNNYNCQNSLNIVIKGAMNLENIYQEIRKEFILNYEQVFSKNIIETIDNISDETVQDFLNKWRHHIKSSCDVNYDLKLDNTCLLNSKRGIGAFIELAYKRNVKWYNTYTTPTN